MATKPTGTSGTLIIDDIGGRVYFRIKNTQGATHASGKSWSGTVNGVSVGGSFSIDGVETVTVGSWTVYTSQTVSFTMGATGTSGLGGPTTLSASVNRSTVPSAPGTPSVSSLTGDRATISWSAASSGGATITDYGLYVSTSSSFSSHVFQDWIGRVTSFRLAANTLVPGVRYFTRVRAQNVNGVGAYSGAREFWTPPAAPTGVGVVRVSDSQQTVSWTNGVGVTGATVRRSTDDGAWQNVGTVTGTASTFTDKTTAGNHKYEYQVASKNTGGQSGWSSVVTIFTAPAAPTGVTAVRTASDDIQVRVSGVPPYATTFDVDDGGVVIATSVSLPYTHVDPNPAVPHAYKVRGKVGSLAGAWSAVSNTVQLIAPPNAPTGLAPNGGVVPSDTDVVFAWVHNPVDSSPQSAFELQYRVDAGSWVPVSGATDEHVSVALDVAAVDWQVRTKGAHADWSPWSAVASFTIIDRPGVSITQPDETWDASILAAAWTWFQGQGRPQSAWRFELLDGLGAIVESRNGSGDTASLMANTRLSEGLWTVRVQAATGEVWSLWAEVTFTVAFDPPAEPIVSGVWDESTGGVGLAVMDEEFGVAVLDVDGAWYAEVGGV